MRSLGAVPTLLSLRPAHGILLAPDFIGGIPLPGRSNDAHGTVAGTLDGRSNDGHGPASPAFPGCSNDGSGSLLRATSLYKRLFLRLFSLLAGRSNDTRGTVAGTFDGRSNDGSSSLLRATSLYKRLFLRLFSLFDGRSNEARHRLSERAKMKMPPCGASRLLDLLIKSVITVPRTTLKSNFTPENFTQFLVAPIF